MIKVLVHSFDDWSEFIDSMWLYQVTQYELSSFWTQVKLIWDKSKNESYLMYLHLLKYT